MEASDPIDPSPSHETQEIELNFRLDADGRTAPPVAAKAAPTATPPPSSSAGLNYRSQTVQTSIGGDSTDQGLLDELLLDCEIADSALMPRTYWMAADARPRFTLEQMALDVFRYHVPSSFAYDPAISGAEWWVQIRPFPAGGRYVMHAAADPDEDDQLDMTKQGVSFHWDKDEDLRQITGGHTYIHPHLSTVTYLTSLGAPTLAINCRIHPLTGEWLPQASKKAEALVSWPRPGKHLSFDGRYLHAAPTDLLPAGVWEESLKFEASAEASVQRRLTRRHRRVTFLVNIWLHYRPFNVQAFPDTMLDKMSHREDDQSGCLVFANRPKKISDEFEKTEEEDSTWTRKNWPMGGSDGDEESIQLALPVSRLHQALKTRGDVRLVWPVEGVELRKCKPSKKNRTDKGP